MDRVYDSYVDKYVSCTHVYKKATDTYAYADSDTKVKISAADLENIFLKRLIIVDGAVKYVPISYSIVEGVGTLTYVKADTTTATTAVLATLVSKEYSAL